MCEIRIKLKEGFPAYSKHFFHGRTFEYEKAEQPKRFKKLLRIAKRTKTKIVSVKSMFDHQGNWIRRFELREGMNHDRQT